MNVDKIFFKKVYKKLIICNIINSIIQMLEIFYKEKHNLKTSQIIYR